jgi:hypothetical protein
VAADGAASRLGVGARQWLSRLLSAAQVQATYCKGRSKAKEVIMEMKLELVDIDHATAFDSSSSDLPRTSTCRRHSPPSCPGLIRRTEVLRDG